MNDKTLIAYASKHGTTRKVVDYICNELINNDIDILDLSSNKTVDLDNYRCVIVGGSIHAGTVQNKVQKFVTVHMEKLMDKKLALFICGMDPNPEKQKLELVQAYPELLRQHAIISIFAGGEFLFDKMNFLERMLIRKIAKTDISVSKVNYDKIDLLVSTLKIQSEL